MKNILTLIIALLIHSLTYGQELKGKVVDKHTGEGIIGAVLQLVNGQKDHGQSGPFCPFGYSCKKYPENHLPGL